MDTGEIQNYLEKNSAKDIAVEYKITKEKMKIILRLQAASVVPEIQEKIINEFLIWFLIRKLNMFVRTVGEIDASQIPNLIQEISRLQQAMLIDRIFWQHKESLVSDDLSKHITSDFSLTIEDKAGDEKWYADWIKYKLGGEYASTRDKQKAKQDFSDEKTGDICNALQYNTYEKTGRYFSLPDEQRKKVNQEIHLLPFQFFLSTCLANNEQPHMSGADAVISAKFYKYLDLIISKDIPDLDDIHERFLLAELRHMHALKVLSVKDFGCLSELKKYDAYLDEKYLEKGKRYQDSVTPWNFSLDERFDAKRIFAKKLIENGQSAQKVATVEAIVAEARLQQFYDDYKSKSLVAFDNILKECTFSIHNQPDKASWNYVPNHSYNLLAFNKITGLIDITDSWIIHKHLLPNGLRYLRTSQTKQLLMEYLKNNRTPVYDSSIIDQCIDLPIQKPPVATKAVLDPYVKYVDTQKEWINPIPAFTPQIDWEKKGWIWC